MLKKEKSVHNVGHEFRVITGGDDGVMAWWNLVYNPAPSYSDDLLVFVNPASVQHIKPVHEIHLSISA